ncbi:hypothetical protein E2C01_099988 [Portunus trituberculatus]|uniref:Uncharacterized protein n=1 Tax=Portunus trituberculatus TaxID=210409 RepID=A0A5B7KGT0_PORTR|nr:hypothetical protein [Portunus trituberculatus]
MRPLKPIVGLQDNGCLSYCRIILSRYTAFANASISRMDSIQGPQR